MSSIQFPIERFFPKEEYKSRCKGNRQLTPLYLIALRQPVDTICQQYEKYKRDPNYAEPQFRFTALAVATMMGNHPVMQYLLSKNVARAPVDKGGLSPLHYACALNDVKSRELLGVVRTVYEIFPGWKNMFEPKMPKGDEVVIYRKGASGVVAPVTADQFKALTGAQFYDGVVASSQEFVNLFAKRLLEKSCDPIENYLLEKIEEFQASPPKLCLGSQGNAGTGVFVGEDVEPGLVLDVYGGELKVAFDSEKRTYGEYVLLDVDGTKVRNYATLTNDSFPNAFIWPLYYPDGRVDYVLLSITKIKKGDPIFHNYSLDHSIKLQDPHQELNPQEMMSYFKQNRFKDLVDALKRIKHVNGEVAPKDMISYLEKVVRVSYLLHTPSSTLLLFLNEILSKEDLALLKDDRILQGLCLPKYPRMREQYLGFHSQIEGLSKILAENSSETRKLKEILLSFLGQHPFHVITHLLNYLISSSSTGANLWKKELTNFPSVMGAIAYFGSLYALSPTDQIDRDAFVRASQELNRTPLFKLDFGVSLLMHPHPTQKRFQPFIPIYFQVPNQ